jgi:hypothetical protein
MPDEIMSRLAERAAAQAELPQPPHAGRRIGLNAGKNAR